MNVAIDSYIANITKIFVNGTWIGVTPTDPEEYIEINLILLVEEMVYLISLYTSISWDIDKR